MIPAKEEIQKAISEVKQYVDQRIQEFKNLKKEGITTFDFRPFVDIEPYQADIFSEACFCILTANSSAVMGIKIQKEIGIEGFKNYPLEKLYEIIRSKGHRFAMQRAERIVLLRNKEKLLENIVKNYENGKEAREILVKEVKGYGYKESSHFLRNTGFEDVAIIDRHISRFLFEKGLVKPRKTITKKVYLECEEALEKIARDMGLTLAELDLYIFYIKTKKVLK
ncbi:MAG: N-glycosylase/DNA lyase [Aquificae bacterium]|nr:N-glycosylase/DNA lyase [Aquificota bacterium]